MVIKEAVAAVMLGGFGLFMIWAGLSKGRFRESMGGGIIPRWVYVVGGVVVLVLPVAYLLLLLGWIG